MLDIYLMKRQGRIYTFTPYHPDFSPLARELGGSYIGSTVWTFHPRFEQDVRALLIDFFGTDDLVTAPTVAALVPLVELPGVSPEDSDVFLFGRSLVSRKKPGQDIKLGDKDTIEVVQGNFPRRSKSRTEPTLDFSPDTVLMVSSIPAMHADLDLPCLTVRPMSPDIEALSTLERELMARLTALRALRTSSTQEA
jgi:hypothetical protein